MEEVYDIIIQGGQSNAEGNGLGPVFQEYIPTEQIRYLTDNRRIEHFEEGLKVFRNNNRICVEIAKERIVDNEVLGDFSLTFAEDYINSGLLEKGRKLLIIRSAVGGTGFMNGHWGAFDYLYFRMIALTDYALSLNPNNRVVAFLWHQGEHDAVLKNTCEKYFESLNAVVNNVKYRYGQAVPFLAADFVYEWSKKQIEICQPIINATRQVVSNYKNAAFIETDNLLSNNQKVGNGDEFHFCRDALHELGHRYFHVYKELTGQLK